MGRLQTEQPTVGKVGIRPAMMVRSHDHGLSAAPLPEDTPQPHPYPTVQAFHHAVRWLCLKYSNQPRNVGVSDVDDRLKAAAVGVRFVRERIVSWNFSRLLARGVRSPRSNR